MSKETLLKNKIFYFFYKYLKIFRNKKGKLFFSEMGEDIIINRLFRKINLGFYIDVGAYHPFKGSLTYLLFKRGWKGVNLDLSKTSIDLFKICRPRDLNINCAVLNKDGKTFFYQNSIINQQNSIFKNDKKQKKIRIKSLKLDSIIKRNCIKRVDFLNVDTEGAELDVVMSLNLKIFRPKLISVEDNNSFSAQDVLKTKLHNYLNKKRYILFNRVGATNIYLSREYKKQAVNNFNV
jgi:FkbM family methyltransferase